MIALALGIAIALLLTGRPAEAFVCEKVKETTGTATSTVSLSWKSRLLSYSLHPEGTHDIIGTQELDTLRASFQVWEDLVATSGVPCTGDDAGTDLRFQEREYASTERYVGYNFLEPDRNENLVLFWDTDWPHRDEAHRVIGLTTVTYNAVTGEILDADIELNSEIFDFRSGDATHRDADLMNTAVHEIGHYLGLAHEADVAHATMFPEAEPGETLKRDLHCDDTTAIVFKYPKAKDNGYCSPPTPACGMCGPPGELTHSVQVHVTDRDNGTGDGEGGCAAVRGRGGWAALLAAIVLGWVCRRRGQTPPLSL